VMLDTFQVFEHESTKPGIEIVIYSGERHKSKKQILDNVTQRFGIKFQVHELKLIQFVNIQSRTLLEAKWYPIATIIGQSLGGVLVALECCLRRKPDIYIDTMGNALAYPLVRFFFAQRVMAYVHYPAISSDMLGLVYQRRPGVTNSRWIAQSYIGTYLKAGYYRLFAMLYGWAGRRGCDLILANGSWTMNHLLQLGWSDNNHDDQRLRLLYPPCGPATTMSEDYNQNNLDDDQELQQLFFDDSDSSSSGKKARKRLVILSVGQFRPEKDQALQLRVFKELLETIKSQINDPSTSAAQCQSLIDIKERLSLVLLGSCRHAQDEALLSSLQKQAEELFPLDHKNRVIFLVNRPLPKLLRCLQHSAVGLHTMWNEHFGISIVEMLAAGLIPVAHDSGGPRSDIIQPGVNGYLATSEAEYAREILKVLLLKEQEPEQHKEMVKRVRESARRFNDEAFAIGWAAAATHLLK